MKEENNKRKIQQEELAFLIESIQKIQYGSVTAMIQDGKIIQIEKNEKIRFRN